MSRFDTAFFIKYLEKKVERMGKIEECKEHNISSKNDSKSSYLTTNGYVDVGIPYDVWPLHLNKKFP